VGNVDKEKSLGTQNTGRGRWDEENRCSDWAYGAVSYRKHRRSDYQMNSSPLSPNSKVYKTSLIFSRIPDLITQAAVRTSSTSWPSSGWAASWMIGISTIIRRLDAWRTFWQHQQKFMN